MELIHIIVPLLFSILNLFLDAYKITVIHKKIRHGINGAAYIAALFICTMISKEYDLLSFLSYSIVSRRVVFGIGLNLRRKLRWDYISKTPSSITDKLEILIFKQRGDLANYTFILLLLITLFYAYSKTAL